MTGPIVWTEASVKHALPDTPVLERDASVARLWWTRGRLRRYATLVDPDDHLRTVTVTWATIANVLNKPGGAVRL